MNSAADVSASTIRRLFGPHISRDRPGTSDEAVLGWYTDHQGELVDVIAARSLAASQAACGWLFDGRGPLDLQARDHGAWLLAPLTQILTGVCDLYRWDGVGNHIEELVDAAIAASTQRGTKAVVGRTAIRRAINAAVTRDPAGTFDLPDGISTLTAAIDGLIRHLEAMSPMDRDWLNEHLSNLFQT